MYVLSMYVDRMDGIALSMGRYDALYSVQYSICNYYYYYYYYGYYYYNCIQHTCAPIRFAIRALIGRGSRIIIIIWREWIVQYGVTTR